SQQRDETLIVDELDDLILSLQSEARLESMFSDPDGFCSTNQRASLRAQSAYPCFREARISRLMSTAGAEWVIAPTEITSTPVFEYFARFSFLIPPDASTRTRSRRPLLINNVKQPPTSFGVILSSRTMSAPASVASTASSAVVTSTSTFFVKLTLSFAFRTQAPTEPASSR